MKENQKSGAHTLEKKSVLIRLYCLNEALNNNIKYINISRQENYHK